MLIKIDNCYPSKDCKGDAVAKFINPSLVSEVELAGVVDGEKVTRVIRTDAEPFYVRGRSPQLLASDIDKA